MSTSPTIELSIWLALKARIDTLPLGYSKAWPATPFEIPSSGGVTQPFLRIGDVSAAPVRQLIKNGKPYRRTGRLVITLVYPLGRDDVMVMNQLAGIIANHFKDGTKARFGKICVTIPRYPHVQPGYEDNGYWNIPVSIPWECFA